MAIANFKPQVWSAQILSNLSKFHVFGQPTVINRDYEGEISDFGDTVKINSIGRITVRDYNSTTGLGDPDELTDAQRLLLIDQQKEFNFRVDDIDRAQARGNVMGEATTEAAYALSDVLDQQIASLYTDATKTIGSDASPETVDATNAYDYLVDLATKLDEKITDANGVEQGATPTAGRFVVVTPEFHGFLLKDDRFVATGDAAAASARANGQVGEAAGFTVMKSNNAPAFNGDGTSTFDNRKVIAGHRMAWSLAEQIVKTEAYRPDKFFADALRGLHVYGAKVVRPYALAVLSYASTVS